MSGGVGRCREEEAGEEEVGGENGGGGGGGGEKRGMGEMDGGVVVKIEVMEEREEERWEWRGRREEEH